MRIWKDLCRVVALVVLVCFLSVGCAHQMGAQSPGELSLLCGAGGAAAGAAIGGATSRNWQGALIGAAVGALVAGLSCFAFAEYKSRQVSDYQQTEQQTGYLPSQGESIQIRQYEITPAAARPGSTVNFTATYSVMTPNPEQDLVVTEIRTLSVRDPQTGIWKELGRVPNQVTIKPGTRQADGKFDVRSGVAEGNYQITFEVVKDAVRDNKTLPLLVTSNQAILASPQARTAQVTATGAKPMTGAAAPTAASTDSAGTTPGGGGSAPSGPLAALGEQQPTAPALAAAVPQPPAPKRIAYFVASRVSGQGTLRAGPGSSHSVVGTIGEGERYPIVEQAGMGDQLWYKIRLDSGHEVWVSGGLGHELEE